MAPQLDLLVQFIVLTLALQQLKLVITAKHTTYHFEFGLHFCESVLPLCINI